MDEDAKLGDILIRENLITESQLKTALDFQKSLGGGLKDIRIKLGFVKDSVLSSLIAEQQHMHTIDISDKEVDAELMERGYRKVNAGKPDFLIAWHIGAQDKVNVERYGYRYGPRGRWYGTNVQVHHYKEGTLILDFVDPEEKQLVWRSTAVGSMRYFTKGEREVQSSVHEMLKKFPPE